MYLRVLPNFSSMRFSVAGFILRFFIHLHFCEQEYRGRSAFFYVLTTSTICWRCFLFPFYNFSFFAKNYVFISVWINIRIFDLTPIAHISIFMPVSSSFHNCSSMIEFDVKDGDASRSSFIVQDCFGYQGLFVFPLEGYIVLWRSVQNCVGILIGISLNL